MDYAQARIQARFGERPEESVWQAIRNAREAATVLEAARSGGLRRWVAGLDASCSSHAIETALRARWRDCVEESAAWMPEPWRAATRWMSGLADLPALCHLARGEPPLAWMAEDPILRPYLLAMPSDRPLRVRQEALAFMPSETRAPVPGSGSDDGLEVRVRQAWCRHWRGLWPSRRETATLDALVALVESGAREPLSFGRQATLRRMRRLFRDMLLRPPAVFVYLAFVAADIGRLRAELLQRVLLREPGLAP